MEPKTKVCSGKHGRGKELLINQFYFDKKTNKYNSYCNDCRKKLAKTTSLKYYYDHKDRVKKYRASEKGKKLRLEADRKHKQNHRKELNEKSRNNVRCLCNHYIRQALRTLKIPNKNMSIDFIQSKRIQLTLYRYAKNQANNLTTEQNHSVIES